MHKVERTTVSFAPEVMELVRAHCTAKGWKLSNYVERCVRKDLAAEGLLIEDRGDEESLPALAIEAQRVVGPERVREALQDLLERTLALPLGLNGGGK